ncbi:MAG: HIT family protein [Candidatus Bathyarchaeia archaeon]
MIAKKEGCILCFPTDKIKGILRGYEYNEQSQQPYVFVPREPEAFGHCIVAAGKHYTDMSDERISRDTKQLTEMISIINNICVKMKKHLKSNGKACEKVYVSTLCETPEMHLHFHLIPRFEGDRKGFRGLLEKELDGTRWMIKESIKENKIREGYYAVSDSEAIVSFNKFLFSSGAWLKSNEEREAEVKRIKETLEKIIEFGQST